ncbi:MAG TPA: O-antigen ligase family protein, partial [bacterium]|nr:O-antigen ligase family protein [bacterium]
MENTISTLRRWLWGLILAFVILVPSFREVDYKSYAVSLGFLLLLLLEGLRLFKRPELSFSPLELYLVLYVGWTCLSYFWSPVDLAASEYLGRFLPCVGLFLLVRQESPEQIASLRPLLWLGGVLCAMAFGFLQGLHLDWLPSYFQTPNGRIFSIFGNPNVYAAFLILSFPVLLLNLPRLKKPFSSPVILGIFTLLFLTSLRLTGSRAGFAALAVEILVLLFMAWPWIAKIKYGKWVILLLSIIVLGFFAEMATAFAFRPTERLEIWKGAFQMILAKPLQGWGVGQFSLNFQPYMTGELSAQALKDNTFAEHVHNEVLEMGVELGLVGLLVAGFFWLRLMGRAIGKCLKSRREGEALSAEILGLTVGLLGLGMTNLFDYNCRLSGISFFLWMSAGLLANRAFPTDKIKFKLQVGALL